MMELVFINRACEKYKNCIKNAILVSGAAGQSAVVPVAPVRRLEFALVTAHLGLSALSQLRNTVSAQKRSRPHAVMTKTGQPVIGQNGAAGQNAQNLAETMLNGCVLEPVIAQIMPVIRASRLETVPVIV